MKPHQLKEISAMAKIVINGETLAALAMANQSIISSRK
jgi:hypothetical protein